MRGRSDGRPRHEQVAAHLRSLIMAGDLAAGAQLPSTQQFVESYGAANATIQRALGALKDEGFLHSRVGKGVYVRDRQPLTIEAGPYLAPSDKAYSYRLLDVAEVRPPADVVAAFGLADDSVAVVRHRLLLHDGDPVELSWSYYPVEIAAGTELAGRARIRGGAPRALADLGYPQHAFVDRLSVRMPTTEELEALELPDDVPVVRQFRVVHSDDLRPVEASVLIKGGHRYELMYRSE
jgi:GntR family transcriptional regulator